MITVDKPADWTSLEKLGIRYLLFRQDAIKKQLDASEKTMRLARFGAWTLYEVSSPQTKKARHEAGPNLAGETVRNRKFP